MKEMAWHSRPASFAIASTVAESRPPESKMTARVVMVQTSRLSGCIEQLPRPQNLVSPKRVIERRFLDEIHFPAEQRRELVLAMHEIPQIPGIVRLENDEQIDVAVVVEIVADHRAEERQLRDPPLAAGLRDALGLHV